MQIFNKPLYEGKLGGFKVVIHKEKTTISAQKDNTFSLTLGLNHPLHRISLLSVDANDMNSVHVIANIIYSTSQALAYGEMNEVRKLDRLLKSIAENFLKKHPSKPISDEEDAANLQFVKDAHDKANMPRAQRRRLDKKNIKNLKKVTNEQTTN